MDVKDTLSIILYYVDYKGLYNTICVNKQWHQLSADRLKIRHQDHIVLPIIHNRLLKAEFIGILRKIFVDYMPDDKLTTSELIDGINTSEFSISSVNILSTLYPFTRKHIDLLYIHLLNKLNFITTENGHQLYKMHSFKLSLFEKTFACFMYLKNLISSVINKSGEIDKLILTDVGKDDHFIIWENNLIPSDLFC